MQRALNWSAHAALQHPGKQTNQRCRPGAGRGGRPHRWQLRQRQPTCSTDGSGSGRSSSENASGGSQRWQLLRQWKQFAARQRRAWKMKPRVVVPWLGFTYSTTSRSNESSCNRAEGSLLIRLAQAEGKAEGSGGAKEANVGLRWQQAAATAGSGIAARRHRPTMGSKRGSGCLHPKQAGAQARSDATATATAAHVLHRRQREAVCRRPASRDRVQPHRLPGGARRLLQHTEVQLAEGRHRCCSACPLAHGPMPTLAGVRRPAGGLRSAGGGDRGDPSACRRWNAAQAVRSGCRGCKSTCDRGARPAERHWATTQLSWLRHRLHRSDPAAEGPPTPSLSSATHARLG